MKSPPARQQGSLPRHWDSSSHLPFPVPRGGSPMAGLTPIDGLGREAVQEAGNVQLAPGGAGKPWEAAAGRRARWARWPPHLHGDIGREDQQAECLDALGQATGRLPGARRAGHVRGAWSQEGVSPRPKPGSRKCSSESWKRTQLVRRHQPATLGAQRADQQADAWKGQTPRVRSCRHFLLWGYPCGQTTHTESN